ncbi:MAG: glycosyltransferase family 1 protein [Alphaproteobacteria bacterium]|nr:glycosyltransferase family 1 protein [Alphaproteobacteria bacterium]
MSRILFSVLSNVHQIVSGKLDIFFQSIVDCLAENGNDVFLLKVNDIPGYPRHNPKAEKILLKKIKRFRPELIITPNHDIPLLFLENTDCPVVVYTADSPMYMQNQDYIRKNPERYFFMHSGWENIFPELLAKDFGIRAERNFYTGYMTAIRAKEMPIKRNIGFVGFVGWGVDYTYIFMNEVRDNETFRRKIREAEEKGILSIEYTQLKTSNIRIKTLDALVDLGLECFGIPNNFRFCGAYSWDLLKCFNFDPVVTLQTMEDVLNSSLISPHLYNYQAPIGLSWRVADVMASNACLISPPKPDLKRMSPYIDIPTFESPAECRELCQKLLKDDVWRKDIVKGCQKAIDDLNQRPVHLLKIIEENIHIPLVNNAKEGVAPVCKPVFTVDLTLFSLKYRLRYKLWKYLSEQKYASPFACKLHKRLSKQLLKKGIIFEYTPLLSMKDRPPEENKDRTA